MPRKTDAHQILTHPTPEQEDALLAILANHECETLEEAADWLAQEAA